MLRERARLEIYDPRVTEEQIRADIMAACKEKSGQLSEADRHLIENNVTVVNDCYQAADGAHAIAVLTEWDEFASLDFQKVIDSMHRPAFLFDGRNLLDRRQLETVGFEVHSIGKSPQRRSAL